MKLGDKVYWGPYGEFEDSRIFIIKDITEEDPVFKRTTYLIQTMNGEHTGLALENELMLVQQKILEGGQDG